MQFIILYCFTYTPIWYIIKFIKLMYYKCLLNLAFFILKEEAGVL